jgi:hypothetical protein
MSKKYVVIGIVLLIVLLGGAGGYFIFSKNTTSNYDDADNAYVESLSTISKTSDPLVSYTDESGFSFSYPKSLEVNDVTPADDSYYTSLELSKGGQKITIDIKTGNVDPYKSNKSAKLIGSTKLGEMSANQYELNGRLITVSIDQGILYTIDGPKDADFFESAQEKIVSTFKFAGQASTAQDISSDENTVYEEEVVE